MRAHRPGSRRCRGVSSSSPSHSGSFCKPALVVAQVGTGIIEGRVTDETDALLPGVTVTISSPALQLPQMVDVTETDGRFQFVDIPIGIYRVQYMLAGFGTVVREDVRLNAGFVARLDIDR